MIITISGTAGSGKSTAAKLLAKELDFKHYSIGDLMRKIAKEKSLTLLELSAKAEKDPEIDKELDKKQIELGKTEDNFIIDSRLGFHFIPHSFKVYLKVSEEEAAKRIFKENRQHEKYQDIKESQEKIKQRKRSEDKRYMDYYKVNYQKESNYNLVIDTTNLSPEKVIKAIRKSISL